MNWPTEYGGFSGRSGVLQVAGLVNYIIAFMAALLIALTLTPAVRRLAHRLGMIDRPDARRIHARPTPRGGGLAVFIAFHLTLLLVVWSGGGEFSPLFSASWRFCFFYTSGLLVLIGLLDDAFGLKPWLKLTGQIVVALLLYTHGLSFSAFFATHFPAWVNCLATVFWIVGAINAFNLIDGMDGLAAGLAFIAATGMACGLFFRGMSAAAIPFLALAGASLGFLRYNFHPASVFLGDTGSMFLGLALATLPLMTASKQELMASLGIPLVAMGIPIFDTAIAIWRRSVRTVLPGVAQAGSHHLRIMQADRDHLHHRVLAKTMNQRRAAMLLYGISVLLVGAGLTAMLLRQRASGIFLVAFVVATFIVVRHLSRVELWDTGRMLLSHTRRRVSRQLVVPLYVILDLALISLAWLVSRWLLDRPLTKEALRTELPVCVASVFVMLALARTYARVWARAQLREYALVSAAICGGILLACGFIILSGMDPDGRLLSFGCLEMVLTIGFLLGLRLSFEVMRESLAAIERLTLLDQANTVHIVACGGGERLHLFLRESRTHVGQNSRVVIGILDDDINLRGRLIFGYPVLGSFDELPAIAAKRRIDLVLLTAELSAVRRQRLIALARQAGLPLREWAFTEQPVS